MPRIPNLSVTNLLVRGIYPSCTLISYTMLSTLVNHDGVVEAPFNYDYGYNIHIGHNMTISKNYTILDVCEVNIRDRYVLRPNVSIYTVTLSTDPEIRVGNIGLNQAKPVVIKDDYWIGGGATILPGRTIRKGSTVGAGSIVTKVCSQTRYAVLP